MTVTAEELAKALHRCASCLEDTLTAKAEDEDLDGVIPNSDVYIEAFELLARYYKSGVKPA